MSMKKKTHSRDLPFENIESTSQHPVKATSLQKDKDPIVKTVLQRFYKDGHSNSENFDVIGVKGRTIEPYQRLLERFWNPKIHAVLNDVRKARVENDIEKERKIYKSVMGDPYSKTMIGIERIWEECAWTELHQFDECFRIGVLNSCYRSQAKAWIKTAKDTYLLPAIAHYFGMDEICVDTKPEQLWALANDLVKNNSLKNKEDNNMVRFRLRCLFSSFGHLYSLLAMVDPIHSKKHKESSYQYFGYKKIDLTYARGLK